MSDARHPGEDTHVVTRRYRRPPGGWWWLALLLVPLLLAGLGSLFGSHDTTAPAAASTPAATVTDTAAPTPTPTDTAATTSPTPTPSTSAPTPSATSSITSIGCASFTQDVSSILKANPITFTSGGSGLTGSSQQTVSAVAAALRRCQTMAAVVTGFTDTTGTDEINRQVSAQRAATVRRALVAAGVPASRVASVGAGAERPVASNDTESGRAQNRRVEIVAN